jgi:tRNA A37 methylthiotransferase MiaB
MRRTYSRERYLALVDKLRAAIPDLALTTDLIVGFPGETEEDVAELETFLTGARLDAVGVFGYSDEDGTEAMSFDGHHDEHVVRERVERITGLADELVAQRAEDRHGEDVEVLVESVAADGTVEGRAAHQAPEVDGSTTVRGLAEPRRVVGRIVGARVVGSEGADLLARATEGGP